MPQLHSITGRKSARALLPVLVALVAAICASRPTLADDDVSILEENAVKAAVERVAPSVVKIETFGGLERVGGMLTGTGPTTGLAVTPDGYIISSAFNFAQKPSQILVHLTGDLRLPAKLVATDHNRMLVLLKVDMPAGKKLAVPVVTPRGEMAVGQWAIALGRTFDTPQPSLSVGIVSALNRVWDKAIQTDAKVSLNNYGGPLVDIRGRVLGVLVPMSPMSNDELAGAEWYDSGIGFAVPLEDVFGLLPRLEKGDDLRPGLLGISMKGIDIYALPADIAAVQPNSPAAKAGIKPGDRVVEIDGRKIARQAQLKHALGPHYAGDKLHLVLLRGKDRIEATVELTAKLVAYAHPFLGILPLRSAGEPAAEPGVPIRWVYPDSPADKAGVKAGDRLTEWQGKPVKNYDELAERMAELAPRAKVHLLVRRGDQAIPFDVELTTLPEAVPAELPPAHNPPSGSADPRLAVGVVPIQVPEVKNKCAAYVPENYHPQVAYGVVIWIHSPGAFKQDELIARWKETCAKSDLILLAPQSAEPERWQREDVDFVRKALDQVTGKYHVDRSRIVVVGEGGGAALAFRLAWANREWIHGVAALDGAAPAGAMPANDPVLRMAYYMAAQAKLPAHAAIEETIARLRAARYPVTSTDLAPDEHNLSAGEVTELARWIDTLDRL